MRSWILLPGAALVAVVAACSDPVTPLPENALPFVPPPVYREWWHQVEECSGRTGDFDAVSWYVVPGEDPFYVETLHGWAYGVWNSQVNRIVLLEWVPSATELVRHEMLHALIRRVDHPVEYFVHRCGALIAGPGLVDELGG